MTTTVEDALTDTARADLSLSSRPRLRHDVVFAESRDGVFVRHTDDAMLLKGATAYRWLSALAPHLNGRNSIEQISSGLPDGHRQTIIRLLNNLVDRGFARDSTGDDIELPAAVEARFASQLSFIEHFVDRPRARLAAWRDARILLLGSGEAMRSVALGLLRNGAAQVAVAGLDDPARSELDAEIDALAAAGVDARVDTVTDTSDIAAAAKGFDLVVASADTLGPAAVAALVASVGPDTRVLPAISVAGKVVLGPLSGSPSGPSWDSLLLRLSDNLGRHELAEVWSALAGLTEWRPVTHAVPVERIIGQALAFDAFRVITGAMPAETADAVLVIDTRTLETDRHHLLAHQRSRHDATGPIAQPESWPTISETQYTEEEGRRIHTDYWKLVHPLVGVLSGVAEEDVDQTPVKVARIRIGGEPDADGVLPPNSRLITAFDIHTVLAARIGALHQTIAGYAAGVTVLDTVTATMPEITELGPAVPMSSLESWNGEPDPDRPIAWATARSLITGEQVRVPAGAVAGSGCREAGSGIGGGANLSDALNAAMLSSFGQRALRRALASSDARPWSVPDPAEDAELDMLVKAAGHLGRTVRLVALPTDGLAAAVVAYGDPDDPRQPCDWTLGTAWSWGEAAKRAVRDLVGVWQLAGAAEPVDLGDRPYAELDPRTIPLSGSTEPPTEPGPWPTTAAAAGCDVLAVETTPADLRGASEVRTVAVLCVRGRGDELSLVAGRR